TERAGLLKGIAGEEAVSALQVLVKQAGSGSLQEFIATLRETQGEAAETARVMGDNLVGDLDELSSAWEDLGIELQTQQNGPLRAIVQMFAEIVGGIKNWVAENPELAGTIVNVVAGLAALVAAGGALTVMLASILGPLALIKYGFAMASVAAGAFSLPVLAVIAAITLLGVAAWMLWRNWDGVVGGLKALWGDLVNAATRAFDALLAFFAGAWASIKEVFGGGITAVSAAILNWSPLGLFYQAFAGVLSYFGVELPGKFTEFGSMLMSGMVQGIKNGLGAVKDAITGAGGQAIGWFKEKLGIRSPSRVFAGLGDDTMAGLKVGLERSQKGPLGSILKAGKALAGAGAVALGLGGAGPALAVDGRLPMQAASDPVTVQGDTIHIHITAAPATDSRELESMINRVMDQRERAKAARIRSALYDTE